MYIKYNFLEEGKEIERLRYSLFDWDDNILKMPTLLHFQKNVDGVWKDIDVTPEEFADIRKKYPSNYIDNPEWRGDLKTTFIEFRDTENGSTFLSDAKKAISNKNFGPSWESFIDNLIQGNLFAIVTTRGHEPETLKGAVEWIIYNILSESQRQEMKNNLRNFNRAFDKQIEDNELISYYLKSCYFIGITSKAFAKQFGFEAYGMLDKGKQEAIRYFTNYVRSSAHKLKIPLKIGFSDDDKRFIKAAKEIFKNIQETHYIEDFYVFDTSNSNIKGGKRIKI